MHLHLQFGPDTPGAGILSTQCLDQSLVRTIPVGNKAAELMMRQDRVARLIFYLLTNSRWEFFALVTGVADNKDNYRYYSQLQKRMPLLLLLPTRTFAWCCCWEQRSGGGRGSSTPEPPVHDHHDQRTPMATEES
jgi:hypothetical protein